MLNDKEKENLHIAIVDDKQDNIELLSLLLNGNGFNNIISITGGRELLEREDLLEFDLVLLDLRMPEIDGLAVLSYLRDQTILRDLPILVLTAATEVQARYDALSRGATDFICKPFDSREVLIRIENALAVRCLQKQRIQKNIELEELVKERTREVEASRLDVIRRLGRAGEYRDNETGAHVIRVSKCCALIAKVIGKSEHFCQTILQASPMHDVGKIGIPDSILLKPGKLTEFESEIMKKHAQIGADILSGSNSYLMQMASIVALTHHEHWDGSGYPAGLSGKSIPLEGRICAIADVYDALTSVRSYKKPWTIPSAVAYIKENKGKCFEPALVDAFLEIQPELVPLKNEYKD